jgi:quinol monooxygenase YgiN
MTRSWTHGTWVAKEGSEGAFAAAWFELARAAGERFGTTPTLLHDTEDPRVFKTFAAWPSREVRDAFRGSDLVREAMAGFEPLLDSMQMIALDEVEPS